jgi:membrane protein DedA with SNARE-associated domain
MHDILHTLPQLLSQYGYIVLFPAGVIAGPAAYLIAGALIASGALNPVIVTLMLVFADLVGDAAYYSLGRWGHGPLVDRIGARLSLTLERLKPIEDRFRRNDWILILVGKTQAFGAVVLYGAGAVRMNFLRFLMWNVIGTFPKIVIFELVGYFFFHTVMRSRRAIDGITVILFGGSLVLLILYWLSAKYLMRRDTPKQTAGDEPIAVPVVSASGTSGSAPRSDAPAPATPDSVAPPPKAKAP